MLFNQDCNLEKRIEKTNAQNDTEKNCIKENSVRKETDKINVFSKFIKDKENKKDCNNSQNYAESIEFSLNTNQSNEIKLPKKSDKKNEDNKINKEIVSHVLNMDSNTCKISKFIY